MLKPLPPTNPSRRSCRSPCIAPVVFFRGDVAMTTEVFKPDGDGPFPVVLYSHGRAGTDAERRDMKVPILRGHALYWMRKGFAVVAPIRPGYGVTGGPDSESSPRTLRSVGQLHRAA